MSNLVPRRTFWMVGWLGVSLVSMACLLGGCGKSDDGGQQSQKAKFEVADDEQADSTGASQRAAGKMSAEAGNLGAGLGGGSAAGQPAQPPSMSISQLENLTVPDGTPQELIAFINQIGQKIMMVQAELQGQPQSVVQARNQELLEAVLQAADKILASGEADQDQRKRAIDVKAAALMTLVQMSGDSQWVEQIKTFGTTLSADKDPAIVVEGRAILFGLTINDLTQRRSQDVDAAMRQLGALLQVKPQTEVVLQVSLQAVKALRDLGHEDTAQEAFKQIAAAFKDNPDPGLAEEAERMSEQLLFVDSDMDANFNAVVVNREGAADIFLAEYGKLLGQPKPGSLTLQKGIRYISVLEQTQHYDLARKLCVLIHDAYNTSPDERLKNAAQQGTQAALRRLDLLGKPLVVDATRLDGSSLDFAAYQGKVVLVAFFQSFVPRCQQELMSVKTQYEKYHEKGFEVIAVSLDPDREMLNRFLADTKLPWVTVTNNELAEKCGVEMVPFFLLLDQEGKVSDIYVPAATLSERLARLYGVTDSATPPEPETSGGAAGQSQNLRRRPRSSDLSRFVLAGPLEPDWPKVLAADSRPLRKEDAPPPDAPPSEQQQEINAAPTAADDAELERAEALVNPYLPRPGLSEFELINFLFDMQEKPTSIRRRPGFTDAMVEAADRVLATSTEDRYQLIAAEAKFTALHEMACRGSDDADRQLATFVAAMVDDKRLEIVRRVKFLQLESRAIGADQLQLTEIPSLLQDLRLFLEAEPKLENRHLRLASATVHAINRLPDEAQRESYFAEFGKLFSNSKDRQLARYGEKLIGSGKGQVSDLVGQPLELEGITDMGTEFDWSSYRGKVVLVDFWATWCGPCLRELPQVRALHERHAADGFEVVAVSLDEDLEVLAKYLEENKVPWSNLIGKEASNLATKYGVRGIPTMVLVDPTGQVVAVGQKVETLEPQIQELLEIASK